MDEVGITGLVLDEVAILDALRELVLTNTLDHARVLDVRVDVDEGLHTVHGPIGDHAVPVIIVIALQLPVPDQTSAFRIGVLANPVLHPDTGHRKLIILHESVFLIDEFLTTHNADDGTLEGPLGQGSHRADRLR